jgi:hypothetical protein
MAHSSVSFHRKFDITDQLAGDLYYRKVSNNSFTLTQSSKTFISKEERSWQSLPCKIHKKWKIAELEESRYFHRLLLSLRRHSVVFLFREQEAFCRHLYLRGSKLSVVFNYFRKKSPPVTFYYPGQGKLSNEWKPFCRRF